MDSLDAEGYVAVFTEDAVIDSNGSISKGHGEIRKIVMNLIKRSIIISRARNRWRFQCGASGSDRSKFVPEIP